MVAKLACQWSLVLVASCGLPLAAAENATTAWVQYLLGRTVLVKRDFPAVSEGIDVRCDKNLTPGISEVEVLDPLARYGIGVGVGEQATITKVVPKDKYIEIHVNGGGRSQWGLGQYRIQTGTAARRRWPAAAG